MNDRIKLVSLALLTLASCANGAPENRESAARGASAVETPTAGGSALAAKAAEPAALSVDDDGDRPPFPDGARAFAKVRETLLQNYYAEGITEDDLYRAAAAGMLEKMDPKMKAWNKLLTPREATEMRNDLRGEVVGVGVHIEFDSKSGYADVLAALPGSPAEKAGVLAGDKIVTVNGKLYKGMRFKDVLGDIRGKAGDAVTLTVLRGDKLVPFTIVRERVAYDQVTSAMMPGSLGYVGIPSFTDKTPGAVRAALESLASKGATSLVVDLRQCPGGSFDRALETADLFLAEGTPVVTLRRKNKPEEKHIAKGKPVLLELPLAVLVDEGTTSGAEFLAGAFREGRRARVVGEKTKGKWSVQSVDELSNGFSFKYTVSLFFTPSGKSYDGVGLAPDVEAAMDDRTLARANAAVKPEERMTIDVQLRTAKELLAAGK